MWGLEFRVSGSGFRAWVLGIGGAGFRAWDLGMGVHSPGFRGVWSLGFGS